MPDLDTSSIVELDRRHLLHPYQGFDSFRTDDVLPITRGSGARLVDNDGREYLDAVGGMWCTNIGLGRDEMADAIAAQVRDLAYANPFVDMTNVPSVQLAARLAELAPGDLNHVFFTLRRLDGGRRDLPARAVLPTCARATREAGDPEQDRCVPRHHVRLGLDRREAGRPDSRVRLPRRSDPPPVLAEPLPLRCRAHRAGVRRRPRRRVRVGDRPDGWAGPAWRRSSREPIMGSGGVIVPPADYLQRIWRALPRQRHPVRLRRGRDGVRPARRVVRVRVDVRHPARHDHRGQGPDVGVPAARGADLQRPDLRRDRRGGTRSVLRRRVHLLRVIPCRAPPGSRTSRSSSAKACSTTSRGSARTSWSSWRSCATSRWSATSVAHT